MRNIFTIFILSYPYFILSRVRDLRFERRIGKRKIGRNIVTHKKDAKRVVCMAIGQKCWEAMEKVDLCRDGREPLEFPNKWLGRRQIFLD